MANCTPVTYAINGTAYTVSTATDMYYSIKNHVMAGVIVIENISGGILSLTNIKTTYTSAPGTNRINFQNMDAKTVEFALMSLNSTEEEEEIPETTAPETTESTEATTETTAPQETETEDKAPDTAVTEETEPEETVPETTETDDVTSEEDTSEEEQAEGFGASIIKFFKKLFNWLFGWLFN